MHLETYPAFFTPRDEEPSLSSFEEKSSEFDWLEIKRTRKQKYIWKAEQVLCILLPSQNYTKNASESKLPISSLSFVKKITTIYKRLFTLGSYLKTMESYDRWVTRRLWGFRHQISKAKISQNVGREASGEHRGTVQNGCEIFAAKGQHFRSPRLISQSCEIFLQLGVIFLQWL